MGSFRETTSSAFTTASASGVFDSVAASESGPKTFPIASSHLRCFMRSLTLRCNCRVRSDGVASGRFRRRWNRISRRGRRSCRRRRSAEARLSAAVRRLICLVTKWSSQVQAPLRSLKTSRQLRGDKVDLLIEHGPADHVKLGLEAFIHQLERLDVGHVARDENGVPISESSHTSAGRLPSSSDRLESLDGVLVSIEADMSSAHRIPAFQSQSTPCAVRSSSTRKHLG